MSDRANPASGILTRIRGFFAERLKRPPTVAVVSLHGVIAAGSRMGGGSINDQTVAPMIEKAFAKKGVKAVALKINSPGGSPAQSALIASRIRRLSAEKDIPVYVFCEDVAASGGYWLACAADEIYVEATTIIGSIGVIYAGFGFHELIGRYGVERRVHTAGTRKSMLDPFKPEDPADIGRLTELQRDLHDIFITYVKDRRGARLTHEDPFNGDVWVGQKAVDAGIADHVGHLVDVMKERYGDTVKFQAFTPSRSLFQKLGLAGGAAFAGEIADALEARAHWARFGL